MKIPTKLVDPTELHKQIRLDILAVIRKYGEQITGEEVLALLSYTVGQTMAMMDQRKYTMEMVNEVIFSNLEKGNMDVIANLMNTGGPRN